MGILLEVYNDMVKEAQAEVVAERAAVLEKYASAASELMQAEFPNDHTQEDVLELADKLIQHDLAVAAENEKLAETKELVGEYVKTAEALLGQEYGKEFTSDDVEKLASRLIEMDAEEEFAKEAELIVEAGFVDAVNEFAGTEFENFDQVEEAVKTAAPSAAKMLATGKKALRSGAKAVKAKAKVTRAKAEQLGGEGLASAQKALKTGWKHVQKHAPGYAAGAGAVGGFGAGYLAGKD